MNTSNAQFVLRRIMLVVSIVLLATVSWANINPVGWNKAVEAVGINGLAMQNPYIEVGNCKLHDGEAISYKEGVWTTSGGCKTKAEKAVGQDSIAYVNNSSYRFELLGGTVETPVSMLQGMGECVLLLGFTTPSGVRLYPGCVGWLLVDEPVLYRLEFLPSIPSLEYSN